MKALRLALRTLAREWRSGELGVLLLALTVAVAALTGVGFLVSRISAAVAVSNTASWPRAAIHDSMAMRCGVASRRCDLATMPTRVMASSYNDPSP